MTPIEFMQEYERRTNTHNFQEVAPLIADDALYWFNDGSFHGIDEIRQAAFEELVVIKDKRLSYLWTISGVTGVMFAIAVFVYLTRPGGG